MDGSTSWCPLRNICLIENYSETKRDVLILATPDTSGIIEYSVFKTDWGWMSVAGSSKGLVGVTLPESSESSALTSINSLHPASQANDSRFKHLAEMLRMYFQGARISFDEQPIDISRATPFVQKVWMITRQIPFGEIRTYSWVAARFGTSGFRAVGQAMSRNPLPIVVPCHRVIYSTGTIGGYGGGLDIKRRLLSLEGLSIPYNVRESNTRLL